MREKHAFFPPVYVLLVASLILSFPARADDDSEYVLDKIGKWEYSFDNSKLSPGAYAMTNTELESFKKKLVHLADIVHGTPMLSPPRGIDVIAFGYACDPNDYYGQYKPPYTTQRIRSALLLRVMHFEKQEGKVVRNDYNPSNMFVYLNNPVSALKNCELGQRPLRDEQGRKICFAPLEIKKLAGYPLYRNGVIVISKRPKLYWIPVSREQYLHALITRSEVTIKKGDRHEANVLNVFKKELNALSPDQRRAQAYVGSGGSSLSWLCPPDAEGARPLVVFNPDFFDPSLPRTAVQLIVIDWSFGAGYDFSEPIRLEVGRTNPAEVRLSELFELLDYRKIAELIDGNGR